MALIKALRDIETLFDEVRKLWDAVEPHHGTPLDLSSERPDGPADSGPGPVTGPVTAEPGPVASGGADG